jgi:hypothetical protein
VSVEEPYRAPFETRTRSKAPQTLDHRYVHAGARDYTTGVYNVAVATRHANPSLGRCAEFRLAESHHLSSAAANEHSSFAVAGVSVKVHSFLLCAGATYRTPNPARTVRKIFVTLNRYKTMTFGVSPDVSVWSFGLVGTCPPGDHGKELMTSP